nr:MAG TPA: hypothetical protein [Caudoviricetes sp.]
MIGATLLGGYLQGRAARQQANAQAAQAQANADIAYNNAQRLQEQAETQAQNNAINEENKRRRLLQQQGQQRANIGAAGITASGSALAAMADSQFNMEQDLAIERYNGRQKVDNIFQQSTDSVNQGDIYATNARAYRKAGKRAMMNNMLQAGLSVAANLYSAKSIGALKAGASGLKDYSIGGFTKMSGLPASTGGGITSYGTSYGNAAGWEKMKW